MGEMEAAGLPPAVPKDETEAQALYDSVMAPNTGAPVAQTDVQAVEKPEATQTSAPATDFEDELKFGDKQIRLPYEKIKMYAQQGYAFNEKNRRLNFEHEQRMNELNKAKETFESERIKHQQTISRFAEIDQFIQNDPEGPQWWAHVVDAWDKRNSGEQGATPAGQGAINTGEIYRRLEQSIEKKIQPVMEFFNQHKTELDRQQAERADKQLETEIESYKKANPQLTWDQIDENGHSVLEVNILKHALELGLKGDNAFRVAANDLLRDELVKHASFKAKENVGKQIQDNTKKGIVAKPKGNQGYQAPKDIRSLSLDQLAKIALEQSGLN